MTTEIRETNPLETLVQDCVAIQRRIKMMLLLVPPSLLFKARRFCHEAMRQVGVLHLACTSEKHLDFEWHWRMICALEDFQKEGIYESHFVNARFYYTLHELKGEWRTTLHSATVDVDDAGFIRRIPLVLGIGVGTNNVPKSALENLAVEVPAALKKIEDALTVFLAINIEAMHDKEDVTYLFRTALNGWEKAEKLSSLLSDCRQEMFLVRDGLSDISMGLLGTKSIAKSKVIAAIRRNAQRSLDHLCEFLDHFTKV